jgi:zinc protease
MGVTKHTLPNGLTVLLKEMHHAPVTSFWVWYGVGSRHEPSGLTGASHWVEHMMFKGTERFPHGALDRLISREGGRFNAFTWLDFTAYYATLRADRIDLVLEIEADRMANTRMAAEEVDSERTVILSELHMYENQPMFLLDVEMSAAAFRVHGYHHSTIGEEVDLETMTRDDLFHHYRRNYVPANAVAVAVGDFETADMLARIERHFGTLPDTAPPAPAVRREPAQRGERRVEVRGPGDTAYILHSFKAPPATHPDYFALSLLNAGFTGGSSLGLFGSTTTNKSSRLYRALVGGGLAAGTFGSLAPTVDPYLYTIGAVARAGQVIEDVDAALAAEVTRLGSEPVDEAELQKALKRAKVQFASAGESVTGQGQMLGYAEIVTGDYRWAETALAQLEAVTVDDLVRVYETYLTPEQRTVGIYRPVSQSNGRR